MWKKLYQKVQNLNKEEIVSLPLPLKKGANEHSFLIVVLEDSVKYSNR